MRSMPIALLAVMLYCALAYGGITLTREHSRIAALWVPNAVMVAILLRTATGSHSALVTGAFMGNVTANLLAGDPFVQAAGLSLCNSVEILLVVHLMRRFSGPRPDMTELRDLMTFSAVGGIVAPILSGAGATIMLSSPSSGIDLAIFPRWVAADGLGMLIVAPTLMIFADAWTNRKSARQRSLSDWILIMGGGVLIAALPFLHVKLPAFFLAGPFVILAAFRLGALGTAIAVVMISMTTTAAAASGVGIMQLIETDLSGKLLIMQGFLVAIFGMSLPVAAALAGRDRLRDEVERARAWAESADRAKSTFLANISHEIRTPMNGVIGFTELLLASDLDDTQRRQVRMIADSGDAMMRLLGDLLDISKIEAGVMNIAEEEVDVIDTIDACIKLLTPAAEQRSIFLNWHFDRSMPRTICGDRLRISQIVLNLVGNAVKYTERGSVTLHVAMNEGDDAAQLEIAVEDTGMGIPPEFQAHIFEEFTQLNAAPEYGSAGLGLAISSRLARLMGGEISVHSEPGKGSIFCLRMPVQPIRHAAEAGAGPAAIAVTTADRRSATILVAEDSDINQVLIESMLTTLGHQVTIVSSGQDAVKAATDPAHNFDLLLMDIRMPGMSGIEACRAIRKTVSSRQLPIIAMTANAYETDVEDCLAADMQAHLAKPIRLDALRNAVNEWLRLEGGTLTSDPSLRVKYQARRAMTIDLLGAMIREGRFIEEDVEGLSQIAHQLAGVAALFGEAELGDDARAVVDLLDGLAMADPNAVRDDLVRIHTRMAA